MSTALVIGAGSAALALAGPDALVPFKDAAGAAAEVGVGFVLDFGGTAAPVVGCVTVPADDNGYQALLAFTQQEHLVSPVYNGAGLLCSIDDVPTGAPGVCGQSEAGEYQFWSYWYMTDGSGQWTYADRGASAAVGSATNGQDVEGWRFQNPGPDNASAPAPRTAPDYDSLCASALAASSTTTTATTPAGTSPSTPPGPPATVPAVAPTIRPTTTPASPTSSLPATPPTTVAPTTSTTTDPSPSGRVGALSAAPVSADHAGGGDAVPLLVGGVVVLVLAAGAVVGWRRRSGAR